MRTLAVLLLVLSVHAANAQAVQQSGNVTPGHAARWTATGVVQDAGTAAAGSLTSLGVTTSGLGICQNSDSITAAGYQQVCLGVTTAGGGQISVQNFGTATAQPFSFLVNGTAAALATITGTFTAADLACFQDSSGVLYDCGAMPIGSNSIKGIVECDGVSITCASGIITTVTGTSGVKGIVQCDNVTIICAAGVITAIGAASASISEGVTTIVSGHTPEFLINVSAVLQGTGRSAPASPVIDFSATASPGFTEGNDAGIEITGTSGNFPTIQFDAFQGGGTGANGRLVFTAANGTNATPTALQDTQNLGGLRFYAYTGAAYALAATLNCTAEDNFSAGYTPTLCQLGSAGFGFRGNQKSKAWTTNGIQWVAAASTLTDSTSAGTVATVFDNFAGSAENTTTSVSTYTNLYGWYFGEPFCSGNLTCTNVWAVGGKSARFGQFSSADAVTITSAGLVTVPLGNMSVGPIVTVAHVSNGDFISNSSNVSAAAIPIQFGAGNMVINAYWRGAPSMNLVGYGGGPNVGVITLGGTDGGGGGGPGVITANNLIGQIFYNSYNSAAWVIGGFEQMQSLENWSPTANGTQWQLYVVPAGATYLGTGASGYILYADWTSGVQIFSQLNVTGASLLSLASAMATNAVNPYQYIATMGGAPTGVPANAANGRSAVVIDSTNHKICWYENAGSVWKCAAGT